MFSFLLIAIPIAVVGYYGTTQIQSLMKKTDELRSSQVIIEKLSGTSNRIEVLIDRLDRAKTLGEVSFLKTQIGKAIYLENELLNSLKRSLVVYEYELKLLSDRFDDKQEKVNEYVQIKGTIQHDEQGLTSPTEGTRQQEDNLIKDIQKDDDNIKEFIETIGNIINENLEKGNKGISETKLIIQFSIGIASFFSIFFGLLITRSTSKRITRLQKAAIGVAKGDLDARVEEKSLDEIGQFSKVFNQMAIRIKASKEVLEKTIKERTVDLENTRSELEKQRTALLNVLEDVSEEKVYKEKESASLLETIGEGIVITDEKGLIAYINPAFEKMLGFTIEDLKGKTFTQAFKVYDFKEKLIAASLLTDKQAISSENKINRLVIQNKQGKNIAALLGVSAIVVEEKYKGVVRVLHDYSEELQLQRQKDDFFSIASHELRTPLTVISGNLDNILQGYGGSKLSEQDLKLLNDVIKASDRLIDIVEAFLNVSRLEQGRMKVNIISLDACELTEKIVKEMESLVKEKNLELKHTCNEKQPIVKADPDKLREILVNLLGNSLKFTEKGRITIDHKIDGDKLVTSITDTGTGVSKDEQSLLFGKFQQATKRTLAREVGGTGLGLYISREFARLMGGEVWLVESEKGEGSTFAFSLPLATDDQPKVAEIPVKK